MARRLPGAARRSGRVPNAQRVHVELARAVRIEHPYRRRWCPLSTKPQSHPLCAASYARQSRRTGPGSLRQASFA